MSKKVLLLILGIVLSGCQYNLKSSESLSFSESLSTSIEQFTSSEELNSNQNSSSNELNNLTSVDYQFNPIKKEPQTEEKTLLLNYQNYNQIGRYATGNYSNQFNRADINIIDGFEFEHYRAIQNSISLCTLLPYYENKDDGTYAGALYNISRISNINKIYMHYEFETISNSGFWMNYGENIYDMQQVKVLSNQLENYIEFNFTHTNFFKIETNGQALKIVDLEIYYQDELTHGSNQFLSYGEDEVRLNPTSYIGELIDGVSSVEVPMNIKINENGTFDILEVKKYTYYSYDYIVAHPEFAEEATLVDPIDVANYYIIFKKYPANYFTSASSAVKNAQSYNLFKNNIRQVSKIYSRTDGYVNALPYNKQNNEYIEFDIDVGNTYILDKKVNRGVGRVVIFKNGFVYEGYDSSPVAVLSDDHYSTFQEYLNIGKYSKRFNAQSRRTQYQWGSPKNLN